MTKYIVVPTQISAFRFIEVSEDSLEGYDFDKSYVEVYTEALTELERNIREIQGDVNHMRIQQILNSEEGPSAMGFMDTEVISDFIYPSEQDLDDSDF